MLIFRIDAPLAPYKHSMHTVFALPSREDSRASRPGTANRWGGIEVIEDAHI
jgi:hypothetical protein